jgi:phosphoribosylanthranilate isomerase
MKKLIFFLTANFVFVASVHAVQISKPAEFEYIHCVAKDAKPAKLTMHYVFDVRDQAKYQLYSSRALPRLKTDRLRLQLIDTKIEQAGAEGYDIVWKSKVQRLQFNLLIHDNGGQILSGQLLSDRGAIEIGCIDASLEK